MGGELMGDSASSRHAIHAGFWLSGGIGAILGDMNCDNALTNADVPAFVVALLDPATYAAQYPLCDIHHGDFDANGTVDGRDIAHFVNCLLAGPCP